MHRVLILATLLAQAAPVGAPATLTDVERLHVQIVQLQQQLVAANAQLEGCRIEAAHPGYRYDPNSGGLVPKPKGAE